MEMFYYVSSLERRRLPGRGSSAGEREDKPRCRRPEGRARGAGGAVGGAATGSPSECRRGAVFACCERTVISSQCPKFGTKTIKQDK